jgi:hypothetical protein
MRQARPLNISNGIFFAILATLPFNLGLHFVIKQAYVSGLLIDYLIPTLYVQDILVGLLLSIWFVTKYRKFSCYLSFLHVKLAIWLCATLLLSASLSSNPFSSLAQAGHFVLYIGFFVYVSLEINFQQKFKEITKIFVALLLLLSLLGFSQFYLQHSVFNNYLFFGEQPYRASTAGVIKEVLFSKAVVPPYGLFRHPNIFAGFMVLLLTWVFYAKKEGLYDNVFVDLALYTGIFLVIMTFSSVALLALILALLYILFATVSHSRKILVTLVFCLFTGGLLFNFLAHNSFALTYSSLYRRAFLLQASYHVLQNHWVVGVGPALISSYLDGYIPWNREIRFVQPVHNIFVLAFAEFGIFGMATFSILFLKGLFAKNKLVVALLLTVVVLGSYDHYFMTIHQTMLLLWFVLGYAFSIVSPKT